MLIWKCGETLHTTATTNYSSDHNVEHKGTATHDVVHQNLFTIITRFDRLKQKQQPILASPKTA